MDYEELAFLIFCIGAIAKEIGEVSGQIHPFSKGD
jgi:hypothetical protein